MVKKKIDRTDPLRPSASAPKKPALGQGSGRPSDKFRFKSTGKPTLSAGGRTGLSREEYKQEKRKAEVEVATGKPYVDPFKKEGELGDIITPPSKEISQTPGMELKPTPEETGKRIYGREVEIRDLRLKLAQPETGKTLDSINRWRMQIKLDNLEKFQENPMIIGIIPLGMGTGTTAMINQGVGQLKVKFATGGLTGSTVTNAKTVALTGSWLSKAGFTIKAAAVLGTIISMTAWGKHVKAEAIEFIPYNYQKALEAGDMESAAELKKIFEEVKDPTGWAAIIEEVPGLGVIKASLDKMKVSEEIIKSIEKRETKSLDRK